MNILFSPPDISDKEIEEVVDALKSGWITTGPKTKQLEKNLQEYTQSKKTCCFNSATAALECALRILGVNGKQDECITSAYTYTASCSVIDHLDATIKLVDVQKDSYFMDYDKLYDSINENTKAIIPVDIAGVPVDYDKIYEIIEAKKSIFRPSNEIQESLGRVALISDSAHALGSTYKGKKIGSFQDIASFSFHAVKNFTTAEGGMLAINIGDVDKIYNDLQLYSLHGQNKDALAKTKLGAWEYDIKGLYYKYNMPDILAAIGLAQLERYDDLLARRKEIIKMYNNGLDNTSISYLNHFGKDYTSNGHLYLTRVEGIDEQTRNDIIVKMAEKGIATNVHFKPIAMMTGYKNLGFDIKDYPNTFEQYKDEITLPLHTLLSDDEVAYVIETYKDIVSGK